MSREIIITNTPQSFIEASRKIVDADNWAELETRKLLASNAFRQAEGCGCLNCRVHAVNMFKNYNAELWRQSPR